MEELIAAFGGENNLRDAALNYVRFHKTNTEARSLVAERIEEVTGIKRATKQVAAPTKSDPNNTREEFDGTEAEYVKDAMAQSGKTPAELSESLFKGDKPISVEFSAQGAPRVGGPKKVAQVYTKSAQQLIEKGDTVLDRAIGMLEQANPGTTVARGEDGKPDVESLAAALKANKERTEREANAALGIE